MTCSFDGSSSTDPDGSIVAYAWSFGQGEGGGQGVQINHTFKAAGTYTVTLLVRDDDGATGSIQRQVMVNGG